ncbi:MAG: YukJ family protein [Cytophagales bacterium]|nr:YukJ family protein [Cytophagales bacterium]
MKSQAFPSEVKYVVIDNFQHPMLDRLKDLPVGFQRLESKPDGLALDFLRGNMFAISDMKPLPHEVPGPDNDLNEKLDFYVREAMGQETAFVYAFGERWGPEADKRDKYFGFLPGNGIHDIHQNQGNIGRWVKDDGIWQDGGLIIHFESENRFVGIFLAFQSQSTVTDDQGHTVGPNPTPTDPTEPDGEEPQPNELLKKLFITAALVNPEGEDMGKEQVLLLNLSNETIDLEGYQILDRLNQKQVLSGQKILPRNVLSLQLDQRAIQLGNKGGSITILDGQGRRLHSVSYSREQAQQPGWLVKF